ncbi:MbtH family NRPS accessory protein [Streptomyces sp. NPDC059224]|uniref:MbtH family NRPS accessory protein n=1 Tax=Streptomyces sp. NPDC059224 TaxID=3346775 RepID=UPI0036AA7C82
MSGNPFVGGDADWLVVVNAARQYALWRPYLDVPKGWRVIHSSPDRDSALDHVEKHCAAAAETPTHHSY